MESMETVRTFLGWCMLLNVGLLLFSSVLRRRAVSTGALSGSKSIEITGGLAVGERIATSATTRLSEGMEVRPLDG